MRLDGLKENVRSHLIDFRVPFTDDGLHACHKVSSSHVFQGSIYALNSQIDVPW